MPPEPPTTTSLKQPATIENQPTTPESGTDSSLHAGGRRSILFVGNFLSETSGSTGISELLSNLLATQNWEVTVTSKKANRLLRLTDMLWQTFSRRAKYDLAHVDIFSGAGFVWAQLTVRLLSMLNKPAILTLRGGNLPAFSKRSPGKVRSLLAAAGSVTTPSHYLQTELKPFRPDIRYLPNGMDLSNYPFSLRETARPRLCWLRAFHEIYNPSLAVQVVALLREDFPDVHLTMIGPDKGDGSFEAVQQMIAAQGLGSHIEITGPIPKAQVPASLQDHDIFLNTTHYESFGVAVMEAGAVGLPIVSTAVGELPYLWSHDHNALLVPADDPQAMAQAVRRILAEEGLARRLSVNARRNAEQFDWQEILVAWENLFAEVLLDRA